MERIDWDGVWESIVSMVGKRSLCSLAQVGAVIADASNRIVATGYNGPPAGLEHGDRSCEYWCSRSMSNDPRSGLDTSLVPCSAIHAEANALLAADRSRWQGGTIFVNKHPCWECCKLIANSGLARMVVRPVNPTPKDHHSHKTYDFLESCGITVEVLE
jgi:dCMP deaminase